MSTAIEKAKPTNVVPFGEHVNVEALLMRAVESGVPVESLERLMNMRRELLAEQARTAFFTALAGFQAECPVIQKTEAVKDRGGSSVRYKFAPLDRIVSTIQPHLQKYELSYTFSASFDLDNQHLIVNCEVHHALGHTESSPFRVPIASDNFMNKAQHFGSASSYAKRYALCNALGLLTGDEDDDAQAAEPSRTAAPPERQQPPAPATQPRQQPERPDRLKLYERITALGIELGYDTRTQLLARSKAEKHSDEVILNKDIPSLENLVAERRKEESGLRSRIYAEFAKLGYSDADIAEYMKKNETLHGGGVNLEEMRLAQLKKVAEGLEVK